MATLLPPPKRQKVYHGVPEPEPEPIQPSPNIVVQFVNENGGALIAPAVNLPANVARQTLEALVNQLRTKASRHDMPIQLYLIRSRRKMTTTCPLHFMSLCPGTLRSQTHRPASSSPSLYKRTC